LEYIKILLFWEVLKIILFLGVGHSVLECSGRALREHVRNTLNVLLTCQDGRSGKFFLLKQNGENFFISDKFHNDMMSRWKLHI